MNFIFGMAVYNKATGRNQPLLNQSKDEQKQCISRALKNKSAQTTHFMKYLKAELYHY